MDKPEPRYINDDTRTSPGMSLRDWFAGMALQGLLKPFGDNPLHHDLAWAAYLIADAMLEARQAKDK